MQVWIGFTGLSENVIFEILTSKLKFKNFFQSNLILEDNLFRYTADVLQFVIPQMCLHFTGSHHKDYL